MPKAEHFESGVASTHFSIALQLRQFGETHHMPQMSRHAEIPSSTEELNSPAFPACSTGRMNKC